MSSRFTMAANSAGDSPAIPKDRSCSPSPRGLALQRLRANRAAPARRLRALRDEGAERQSQLCPITCAQGHVALRTTLELVATDIE